MAGGNTRTIPIALGGNGDIAVTKFAAAGITGSSAMPTEGVHSLDTISARAAERIVAAIQREVAQEFPIVTKVFVEPRDSRDVLPV